MSQSAYLGNPMRLGYDPGGWDYSIVDTGLYSSGIIIGGLNYAPVHTGCFTIANGFEMTLKFKCKYCHKFVNTTDVHKSSLCPHCHIDQNHS